MRLGKSLRMIGENRPEAVFTSQSRLNHLDKNRNPLYAYFKARPEIL